MKSFVLAILAASAVLARPLDPYNAPAKREVPQEHSHQQFLTTVQTSLAKNNPNGIVDSVFGLLGNGAAAQGLGKLTDTECLQQETADQAFTNAKAAGDVTGMTAALIYRALERNTGSVGLKSNSCTSATAVNPEIAAIQQHQDPASAGAAATNKAITLALAKQIASVGGNAQDALKAGTFAPGNTGDTTGAGNTCDVATDPVGCIFTQKLIVEDATAAEIQQAVAGVAAGSASGSGAAAAAASPAATAASPAAAAASPSAAAASSCKAGGKGSSANAGAAAGASNASTGAAASAANSTTAATGTATFGSASCSDPAIAFGVGFDGRTEASFEPDDKAVFQHGSAQNIGIVAQFICDRLNDQCKASAATVSTCRAAQTKVNGRKDGAAANEFNQALGVTASKVGVDIAAGASSAAAPAATA